MEVSLEEVRDLRKSLRGSVERGEVATQPRRGSWSRDNRHKKERFSDYNAIQKSRDMVEGHPKRRYANGVLGRAWEGQGHLHSYTDLRKALGMCRPGELKRLERKAGFEFGDDDNVPPTPDLPPISREAFLQKMAEDGLLDQIKTTLRGAFAEPGGRRRSKAASGVPPTDEQVTSIATAFLARATTTILPAQGAAAEADDVDAAAAAAGGENPPPGFMVSRDSMIIELSDPAFCSGVKELLGYEPANQGDKPRTIGATKLKELSIELAASIIRHLFPEPEASGEEEAEEDEEDKKPPAMEKGNKKTASPRKRDDDEEDDSGREDQGLRKDKRAHGSEEGEDEDDGDKPPPKPGASPREEPADDHSTPGTDKAALPERTEEKKRVREVDDDDEEETVKGPKRLMGEKEATEEVTPLSGSSGRTDADNDSSAQREKEAAAAGGMSFMEGAKEEEEAEDKVADESKDDVEKGTASSSSSSTPSDAALGKPTTAAAADHDGAQHVQTSAVCAFDECHWGRTLKEGDEDVVKGPCGHPIAHGVCFEFLRMFGHPTGCRVEGCNQSAVGAASTGSSSSAASSSSDPSARKLKSGTPAERADKEEVAVSEPPKGCQYHACELRGQVDEADDDMVMGACKHVIAHKVCMPRFLTGLFPKTCRIPGCLRTLEPEVVRPFLHDDRFIRYCEEYKREQYMMEEHAAAKRRQQEDKAQSFMKKMNEFNQSRGEEQEDLAAQLEEKEEEYRRLSTQFALEHRKLTDAAHALLNFEALNGGEDLHDGRSLEGLVPTKDVGMVSPDVMAQAFGGDVITGARALSQAMRMCRDSGFQPFKYVNGVASIDLDDPAMLLFANTHGRKATKVLADALLERETYNASGGYATKVLFGLPPGKTTGHRVLEAHEALPETLHNLLRLVRERDAMVVSKKGVIRKLNREADNLFDENVKLRKEVAKLKRKLRMQQEDGDDEEEEDDDGDDDGDDDDDEGEEEDDDDEEEDEDA